MTRRTGRRALGTCILLVAGLATAGTVRAGTGIYTSFWSGSNITLSTTSYKYSNASAWWQNLLNSTGKCVVVDGIFGNQTKNATISWQSDTTFGNGSPFTPGAADGKVNTDDFNAMQFAKDPFGFYRHQYAGYTDGYGTQYWTYYGGGEPALLGWNQYAAQQFFNPFRISQASQTSGWTLIPASANRTISSFGCAA